MIRRLQLFLIASGVFIAGLSLAQEPPGQPDEPPVRLKKKNKTEPDKGEPAKPPMKDDKKNPEPPKKGDPKDDEPAPTTPQEDETEVLQRVAKNVRLAEEKLANKELNDGTRQLQEDILKDLDSLIRAAENPPQGGGGGGGGEDDKQDKANDSKSNGGGSMSKQGSGKQGGGSSSSSRSARAERRQRSGSQQANKGGKSNGTGNPGNQQAKNKDEPGNQQANSKTGNGGNGGKSEDGPNKNADLYKDVWGHLPEALRAEMNAYSNDKQFMAKYDELIKRYYRTIAEQGRRKGD